MGKFIKHIGCPSCINNNQDNSRDNLAVYLEEKNNKGQYYAICQACNTYMNNEDLGAINHETHLPNPNLQGTFKKPQIPLISKGEYIDIKPWKISRSVCEAYRYSCSTYNNDKVHVANFMDDKGLIQAQKLRTRHKKFIWVGDTENYKYSLFGAHLHKPSDRVGITITEGEKDCLALATVLNLKYPVVGVVGGAQGAFKAIKHNKQYLDSFKHITLLFDGDEAGRKAQQVCSELFDISKVRLGKMPDGEDVHSLYEKGNESEIRNLFYSADIPRPADVVRLSDYSQEELYKPDPLGHPIPYSELNKVIRGIKSGRLYTVCAASGLGKSSFVKEISYHLAKNHNIKIGNLFLEQDEKEAMRDYIAMDNNINPVVFSEDVDSISRDDRELSENFIDNTMYFFKHFGSLGGESLLKKIEYMMVGLDCQLIVLDHLSMAVSGEIGSGDERKDIDILVTKLRSLINRTQVPVMQIVHLKRPPSDRNYNHGGEVYLTDLRGSASIEQLSDFVIALERNQQSLDPVEAHTTSIRLLKNRRGGKVGLVGKMRYNAVTGRLLDVKERH